jgi:hypothetical protein
MTERNANEAKLEAQAQNHTQTQEGCRTHSGKNAPNTFRFIFFFFSFFFFLKQMTKDPVYQLLNLSLTLHI